MPWRKSCWQPQRRSSLQVPMFAGTKMSCKEMSEYAIDWHPCAFETCWFAAFADLAPGLLSCSFLLHTKERCSSFAHKETVHLLLHTRRACDTMLGCRTGGQATVGLAFGAAATGWAFGGPGAMGQATCAVVAAAAAIAWRAAGT